MILLSRNVYDLRFVKIVFFEWTKLAQFGNISDVITADGPTKKTLVKQLKVINPFSKSMLTAW